MFSILKEWLYREADKTVSSQIEVSEMTTLFQTQIVPMPVCKYEVMCSCTFIIHNHNNLQSTKYLNKLKVSGSLKCWKDSSTFIYLTDIEIDVANIADLTYCQISQRYLIETSEHEFQNAIENFLFGSIKKWSFISSKARIVLFLQGIKWILLFIARIAMRKFHILEGLNQL